MAERITLADLLAARIDRMAAVMLNGGASEADVKDAIRARLGGQKIDGRTLNGIVSRAKGALKAGQAFQSLPSGKALPGKLTPGNVIFKQGEYVYGANVTFRYGRSTSETRYFELRSDRPLTIDEATARMETGSSVLSTLAGSEKNTRKIQYRFGSVDFIAVYRGNPIGS